MKAAAYDCMPRPNLARGGLSISAVQPSHIDSIRRWRNAQMDVLRQSSPIGEEQQRAYYAARIWPTMLSERPDTILLVYEEAGQAIGYGGLVHIAWEHKRAEVSFLLDPELASRPEAYVRYFGTFLALMQELAFDDLGLNRLFVETYAIREQHIAILERAGFEREGLMREHVFIDGRPCDSLVHGCISEYKRSGTP